MSSDGFAWTGDFLNASTTSSTNIVFTWTTGTANTSVWHQVIPNKDWMPNRHFEYDPLWHKKFARYKLQMESMWD